MLLRAALIACIGFVLTANAAAEADRGNSRSVKETLRKILDRPEFRNLKPYKRKQRGRPPVFRGDKDGRRGGDEIVDPNGNPVIVRDDNGQGEVYRGDDGNRAIIGRDEDGKNVRLRDDKGNDVVIREGDGEGEVPRDQRGRPVIFRDKDKRTFIERDGRGRAVIGQDQHGRDIILRDQQGREVICRDGKASDRVTRDFKGRPIIYRDAEGRAEIKRGKDGRAVLGKDADGRDVVLRGDFGRDAVVRDGKPDEEVVRDHQRRPVVFKGCNGKANIGRDDKGRAVLGKDRNGDDVLMRDDRNRRVLARNEEEMRRAWERAQRAQQFGDGGRDVDGGNNGGDGHQNDVPQDVGQNDGGGNNGGGGGEFNAEPDNSSSGSSGPTIPTGSGAGVGAAFGAIVQFLGIAFLVIVAAVILYFVVMGLTSYFRDRKSRTSKIATTTAAANDPLEPDQSPGDLPADVYVDRARALASEGKFREAIAQLLLGGMSHLERAGIVKFRKGLTHRDYVRASRSEPGHNQAMRQMVKLYEPLGFGRRTPNRDQFEQSLSAYQTGFRGAPASPSN